ncbi:Ig-like domain-containing protein [Pseudoalteromonas luteoviolacea]|uniref:Ig-like domain-containing protein n=1 Tax=Pseudoalteromonas luteoviolacea TaxID=43657 RepID=UPI0031BAA6B9|nr:Ig-like domain-containing protein [Pseudoalteromonas luteoviolacea]
MTSASQTISNIDLSALNDGTLTLSVTLTDTVGNTATAVTATSELDTSSPSVTTFSASDTALKVGETSTVTIVLSESSDNFTVDDVSVSGGTLSNFTATSGTQYSVVFTPSENSEADATLDILADKFTDSAGNPNTAAQQITLSVDTSSPTGQAVNIDQALINRDNESALSFSLTGLESSGTFTYSITDANNASVTGNGNITAATAQVSAIDVSNLAEGTLTLTVIVTDAAGNSANQISDTVTKKYNVAPTLSGQPTTSIAQDQAYSFTPTLVDPDEQDTHTYSITNLPSWLMFSTTTGVLSGTPADADVGEYNGIVISVNDGTDSASLASFNIEVTNVNDAPSGTAFNFATQEAGTLSVTAQAGLLSTATDDDTDNGDTLTVEQVAAPSFGQLTLNTDGSFTYQHDGSENHTDQFTYRVKDASNATSETYTVTINVTPVADAPTAVNDVLTVVEDNAGNIDLLANDSDPEQDMVASSATVVTAPSKGSVSLLNGVATYTPNANENGVDTFTYTVKDAQQNTSNTATVTVTITADNDLPVAKELVINTSEDTHSDPLQVRAQTTDIEDGIPTGDLAISTQPSKGSVVIDQQQGTFVYQPAANQTGSDSFAYTVADSAGAVSTPMTITVNIGAVNDKPVAAADSVTTDEDVSTLLSILSNDSDVEDQGFNGANITLEDQGNGAGSYEKAMVTIQADGQLNIVPVANQNGTFTFNYTLTDSEGLTSDPAQVTVTLTPVNDAPVAVDNTASLQEEGSFEVNVLGNDTDVDENDSFNLASVTVVDQPQFGQAVVNAQGGIVYTPNQHYFGDDTFTYTVQDTTGATSNKATVTMTVTPVNDAPIAQAQNLNLDEDGSLLVTLSATDQENDALIYRVVTGVSSGTLVQQSDTTWLYTPTSNFNGVDTFTFVANDGTDDSAAATVSLTVNAVNDQPTVTGQAVSVDEETQVNITLSAEDIDNDNLTYLLVGEPSNGSYSLNSNVLSYTGNLDYFGADSFTFKVNDGQADSELATVNITVNNINDAPTISGSPSKQVNEDSAYSFVPTAEDKDGDNLTFAIENLPSWMSFDSTTGAISGTPVNANVGVYTGIVISVSDGTETAALTAFNITVVNTNDTPTISGVPSTSINEDSAYSFTPSATDIDGDTLTFSIQNAPAWIEFNTATGEMTGIPLDANVGTDTNIIVSVSDGQISASIAAFDIVVNNTNDAPTAIAPSYSISEGATLSVSNVEGLLSGNFALDDDLDSNDVLSIVDLTQPTFGTLSVNADGSFSYSHNDSETQSDSFTYRLQDSIGAQSRVVTATIAITPVSDSPVAVDDSAQTNEDTPVTVNLLSNDTDPEGDIVASSAVVVDQPAIGSVLIENGVATYTPNQDVNGTDLFTYIVSDQDSNNSDKATVSITISAINDVPQVEDITVNIDEDAEQTSINVMAFATDIEDGIPTGDIAVITAPQKGNAVTNSINGSIDYTPFEDDEGTDSFTYTIADSNGAVSELATVSINIGEVNDAPIAADDSVTTQEDTQITLNILANDTDVEDEGFNGANITIQNNGVFDFATVAILTDGQLQITPTQDQNGQFSFTYTLNDSEGLSSLPATVNLTIEAVNDAPVAIDDIAALEEEGAFAVNVLGNDTDVDGNNEIDPSSVTIVNAPAKGQVSIDGLGRVVYTANTNEVGNDIFTYTVKDTLGLESNVATVTMTIDNVNDAPDAQDDSYSEETFDEATGTYRLAVLSNDSDVDTGDSLMLLSAQASVGSVQVAGNELVYTPEDTFNGVVIIDYVIKDEAGEISRAVAELTVVRNDAQGTPPTINVPADINVNATALFTKVELGNATATDSNGNVIGVSLVNNNVLFPPGRHLATWRAQDSNGLSTFATQNVFVNPLVSLAKDTQLSEGQSFALGVFLNGEATQYPIQIPYTVSGTANSSDHTLSSGTLTIASGIEGEITFSIFEDGLSEGNETIIITLDESLNRGAKFTTQVTIVEENVAPSIVLSAKQNNELRTTVTANEQLVTVSAQVSDPNIGDSVQLQWSALDNELQNLSTVENEFTFSAQSLSTGIYGVSITATDDGEPSLASTAQIYLEVVPELVVLTDQDTDGDLIPDNEEGHSDSDNDGIPDFQDAITDCNVMQEQALESSQFLIEGEPGVCIRKGVTIAQNSTGGVQLLPEELQQDDTATNIGGLFDFIAVGLPQAGDSYSIVIPQRNPIPINAVYRKLIGTQWVDFIVDEQNKIYSSLGEPGYCAPPGSDVWREGLTEGDWCVKLQIVDGGPNDDDGIANGSIIDPGGVAIVNNGNSLPVAVADEKVVGSGQAIQIDVLANDTDADGDTLTITSASVDFGTVVIEDNKLLYTPPQTFVGTATIQYSITDGQGGTASNTVTVNLTVNSAPTTTLDEASTTDQASIILNVLENDFDADGDTLSVIDAVAQSGTVSINADGTISYTPKSGFEGVDIVTYTVVDSKGAISKGVAQITVTAYKAVAIENTSSGSLGGGLILILSALLVRRRKSGLPSFALASLSCILPFSAYADGWELKGTLGQANAAERVDNNSGLQIKNIDNSSESWSVSSYYELLPNWHVGIGYVDLGQGRVDFEGESLSPAESHLAVSRIAPVLPEGFTLQVNYDLYRWQKLTAEVFVGVFDWEYKITSTRDERFLQTYEAAETNAFMGAELGYQLSERVELGVQYRYFDISENNINEVSLLMGIKF